MRSTITIGAALGALAAACLATGLAAQERSYRPTITAREMATAAERAADTVAAMDASELTQLTWGIMPISGFGDIKMPEDALPAAGYVRGIPARGIPPLLETDGPLGVAYVFGMRQDYATPLPSGVAMGSTFNPDLIYAGGQVIGAEAKAKGFNTVLAGGANLMRDPRNGRTFEYISEDPLLTGELVGAQVAGIQSNGVISTIKHFALNGQETGRRFVDVHIADAAARESDLLAFEIGIERGMPASVMCAYNRVNGDYGCASDYLLNQVLKRDWGYRGFVMSDWGAVPGHFAALAGLDQQSGAQIDPEIWFDDTMLTLAGEDDRYAARLRDMNTRILTAIYAAGVDRTAPAEAAPIDVGANAAVSERIAREGIVLLKNEGVLPLAGSARHIAVIGGYAASGTLSGGGSSQTHGEGGASVSLPLGAGGGDLFGAAQYHRNNPLAAIQAHVPDAKVNFRDGRYITDAVEQARQADIAIVFATQWMSEGFDVPDLSLPQGQDALIAAVAAANPRTVVVLETGGPVLMPWLDDVAAVIEAWYPGGSGDKAIAAVLFGEHNPSGHLPITFPAGIADLPRPTIPGSDWVEPNFQGDVANPDADLFVDYDIEGSDLGYRWNAREGHRALFPFGFGLSYSEFALTDFATDGRTARFAIANAGDRVGADVAQVYLLSVDGKPMQRLVGFARRSLEPDESSAVEIPIDQRLLASWSEGEWVIAPGRYVFGLASDAQTIAEQVEVTLPETRWPGSVAGD